MSIGRETYSLFLTQCLYHLSKFMQAYSIIGYPNYQSREKGIPACIPVFFCF